MADISITQIHKMGPNRAKAAAQKVADQLAAEYGMSVEWDDDVLTFKRSGVSGRLVLQDKKAQIDIKLGFLLMAFAASIEEQVAKNMKKVFGGKA